MVIYNTTNISSGMDDALYSVATQVNTFIPMFLLFVFGTIFLGGITSQRKRTGYADAPMWAVTASIGTFLIAFPLTLASGLINLTTFSIIIIVTCFSGIWFFLTRNKNEA